MFKIIGGYVSHTKEGRNGNRVSETSKGFWLVQDHEGLPGTGPSLGDASEVWCLQWACSVQLECAKTNCLHQKQRSAPSPVLEFVRLLMECWPSSLSWGNCLRVTQALFTRFLLTSVQKQERVSKFFFFFFLTFAFHLSMLTCLRRFWNHPSEVQYVKSDIFWTEKIKGGLFLFLKLPVVIQKNILQGPTLLLLGLAACQKQDLERC